MLDNDIVAYRGNGFQRHVLRTVDDSFFVLLDEDRADQSGVGVLVGEDADDVGAAGRGRHRQECRNLPASPTPPAPGGVSAGSSPDR